MTELRKDPIVGRWVIIAPERGTRPHTIRHQPILDADAFDPFLEGNEDATTPEVLAYREPGSRPNGPGWRVRVLRNKFPALRIEGDLHERGDGLYDMMNGVGAHEVIIECPHRETNMSRLPVVAVREVLWAYRDRLVNLKRDPRLVHPLIFKNQGAAAGASLDHSHSQLIVNPIVPINVIEELTGAESFYQLRGRSIFQEIIEHELADARRVVLDTPDFLVVCPFASRFPFETWIIPRRHRSHFETVPREEMDELGAVLQQTLRRLELALDDPPYNYVIHTAPFNTDNLPHYSWHLEIYPRITGIAGFEWGSGFYINTVAPEQAARFLRDVNVS
jgi:UDPglucose--hexose-1-phosphate uridylyltransferase